METTAGRFPPLAHQKGDSSIMDFIMVGILLAGVGLIWALLHWCQQQVDAQDIG